MSSHLINEFRSLCVTVYDAVANRDRYVLWVLNIVYFELDSFTDFPYSLASQRRVGEFAFNFEFTMAGNSKIQIFKLTETAEKGHLKVGKI